MTAASDLRYPIGRFVPYADGDRAARAAAIAAIAALPDELAAAVQGLDAARLATPYRDGGWTVRQVVHHLADSHMNAYVRSKLALSADTPAINAYDENQWAELADGKTAPSEWSLQLLAALHARWVQCLRALPDAAFARALVHPEHGRMTLDQVVGLYGWHGRHHVAHIQGLRARRGW